MRRVIVVLTTLTLVALVSAACGTSESSDVGAVEEGRTVAALGFGRAEDPATEARLVFAVASTDDAPITVEALQPLVTALNEAGIDAADIETNVVSDPYGPSSPSGRGSPYPSMLGEVSVTVHDITTERLDAVVETVEQAADDTETLRIEYVGVLYGVADCAALRQTADEVAIEDASERAASLAATLGGSLGEIISITEEAPGWGSGGPTMCDLEIAMMGPAMNCPAYSAQQPAAVMIAPVVRVTFAVNETE